MTPAMVRALSSAFSCLHHRGLQKVRGGWMSTHPRLSAELYSASSVRALIALGYLDLWGGGNGCPQVAHITARGERALTDWSEQLAARKRADATIERSA